MTPRRPGVILWDALREMDAEVAAEFWDWAVADRGYKPETVLLSDLLAKFKIYDARLGPETAVPLSKED